MSNKNYENITNYYKAFGLTINSVLPLLELIPIKDCINQEDVTITFGDLTAIKNTYLKENTYFYINEDLCLFHIPDVAIFSISKGKEIIVSPYANANNDQIRLYVLGTCMGAILMQRRVLPLHGSAIFVEGKAYAIVGHSGAGKSTLASAFIQKGALLLSDDVIPIKFTEDNTPMIIPAYPQQKLWIESLNGFAMDHSNLRPIFNRENKYTIPVTNQFHDQPIALFGIIELVKVDHEQIVLSNIDKMQRFPLLYEHTYRNFFLNGMNQIEWHFSESAKVANKVPIFRVERPTSYFSAYELVDLIKSVMGIETVTT
ncbi:aldolase [Bacillus sp. AGMB 02131]|uniref:Aldolase n=1 Tax=Peribacillus faecalis TaxID=2772559 RepID=A0A927CXA8_9BACI|nr:aldolase [Peribacillus faecalis]MBD3107665.1 aldolase [Peribacillus faecalis]